jgi:hypothetical protein
MKTGLTKEDIKELKYSCRFGLLIPLIVFLICGIVSIGISLNGNWSWIQNLILFIGPLFVLCTIVSFLIIRKQIADIVNGEKILILKKVIRKEYRLDFEPGSGLLLSKMKPVDIWYLIIDNYRYPVDKKLFESLSEGDEVYLHLAPLSQELLNIEKKSEYA